MPNATNITYGDYNFQRDGGPVPFLTINKNYKRLDNGDKIGSTYNVTLQGEVNMVPSGIVGYKNVDYMQDLLCSGFDEDFKEFKVTCGGQTLIQQYPRINNISFTPTNDNWSVSSDFTIELEWDGDTLSGLNLDSINETWDFQIDNTASHYELGLPGATGDNNMHLFSLTHNISAQGVKSGIGVNSGVAGWQQAKQYVISQLGYNNDQISNSGVFNLDASSFSGWNHSRIQKVGEAQGTFEVTETWLVANTGFQENCGAAIEDFNANISFSSSNGLTTIGINGSIQGLEEVDYGNSPGDYNIAENKYNNASGFWECVKPKLPGRAQLLSDNVDVNLIPIDYTISHNPTNGVINYNYQFDNRPCNFIPNALSESISIDDNNPTDVFAELAILGRGYGPVLQDLDTVTSNARTVNISLVMGPVSGCSDISFAISGKPDVSSLLCALQQDISGANTQLFKSQDRESWNFKTGQFNRTVQWVWTNCSGEFPNTSFC